MSTEPEWICPRCGGVHLSRIGDRLHCNDELNIHCDYKWTIGIRKTVCRGGVEGEIRESLRKLQHAAYGSLVDAGVSPSNTEPLSIQVAINELARRAGQQKAPVGGG